MVIMGCMVVGLVEGCRGKGLVLLICWWGIFAKGEEEVFCCWLLGRLRGLRVVHFREDDFGGGGDFTRGSLFVWKGLLGFVSAFSWELALVFDVSLFVRTCDG